MTYILSPIYRVSFTLSVCQNGTWKELQNDINWSRPLTARGLTRILKRDSEIDSSWESWKVIRIQNMKWEN